MALILMILLIPVAMVCAETLTLSTYYPAPFGSYDRMRLVPRGTAPTCDGTLIGSIYFDSNAMATRVCDENGNWEPLTGVWEQSGDNIFVQSPDAGVEYHVGIGDATPEAVLEVSAANTGDDLLMLSRDEDNDGDALVVKGSGRVGIGGNDPGSMLVINGAGITAATSSLLVVDNNGDTILFVRDDKRVSIGQTGTMDNELEVNGAIDVEVAGRDSVVRFQETTGGTWYSMGIDRSDGGKFKINFGGGLGANDHFSMSPTGDVVIGGSLTLDNGINVGGVQVDWVADAAQPGFYATYAP